MQGMYSQDGGDVRGVGVPKGAQAHQVQAVPGRTFRTVDQVLRWAFEAEQYRGAKVANYSPCTAAATGGDKLGALDRMAQAACIQARVNRLPEDARMMVLALYSWNREASQSINELCRRGVKRVDIGPAPLIEALVVRHCRQVRRIGSESLRTLAIVHGVPWSTAKRREDRVRGWLCGLWYDTENKLFHDWVTTGLIQP